MLDRAATELVKADEYTAFILGNGPSLRGVDLRRLAGFATFGLNAAYRHWREIDWRPTHYACLDVVVGLSHQDAVADLIDEGRIGRFLLRENLIQALGARGRGRKIVSFDALAAREPALAAGPITTGSHTALWAAHLGYRSIVVLGVDGRYRQIVDGAERREGIALEIVREGSNPNYFFDDYQRPGDRYNLPDPRPGLHLEAWRAAAACLPALQARAYNANSASDVRCLPFVALDEVLGVGAQPDHADEAPASCPPLTRQAAPNGSARHRLFSVARAQLGLLAALAVLCAALAGIGTLSGVGGFACLSAIVIGAVGAALIYTRTVAAWHVNRLQTEVDGLRARLGDLERRLDDDRRP